jgi:hypothetical protein
MSVFLPDALHPKHQLLFVETPQLTLFLVFPVFFRSAPQIGKGSSHWRPNRVKVGLRDAVHSS